jgi:hypothetical protein
MFWLIAFGLDAYDVLRQQVVSHHYPIAPGHLTSAAIATRSHRSPTLPPRHPPTCVSTGSPVICLCPGLSAPWLHCFAHDERNTTMYRVRLGWPVRLSSCAALCICLQPHLCRAEDTCAPRERPSRVEVAAGYAPLSYVWSSFEHSEARRNKDPGAFFRGAYAFRVVRGLELGGALTTANTDLSVLLMPAGTARGFLTFADIIEVGLTARVGLLLATDDGDVGYALSGGPDVRIWAAPALAFQLGGSASRARGASSNPNHEIVFMTLGAIEFGVVIAL